MLAAEETRKIMKSLSQFAQWRGTSFSLLESSGEESVFAGVQQLPWGGEMEPTPPPPCREAWLWGAG